MRISFSERRTRRDRPSVHYQTSIFSGGKWHHQLLKVFESQSQMILQTFRNEFPKIVNLTFGLAENEDLLASKHCLVFVDRRWEEPNWILAWKPGDGHIQLGTPCGVQTTFRLEIKSDCMRNSMLAGGIVADRRMRGMA